MAGPSLWRRAATWTSTVPTFGLKRPGALLRTAQSRVRGQRTGTQLYGTVPAPNVPSMTSPPASRTFCALITKPQTPRRRMTTLPARSTSKGSQPKLAASVSSNEGT
jgi:hypothetical protein